MGPPSISVPNFKRIALFVQKILRGSQNLEIRSRDPGHDHLGVAIYSACRRGPSSISVPNLKRIAQFVQKLLRGPKNLEIRSLEPGHADLGVILWSVRREGPSSMSVSNFKQIALFVQKLLGVPKFRNWVTWPRPRPLRGRFIFRMLERSVLHLCTKFEADRSIRS